MQDPVDQIHTKSFQKLCLETFDIKLVFNQIKKHQSS